jgi:hypothetical protein
MESVSVKRWWKRWISDKQNNQKESRVYSFRGLEAKVSFVLDSVRRYRTLPKVLKAREVGSESEDERSEKEIKIASTEFNPSVPHERWVVGICERWKARCVLDKVYRQYGCKKRPCKKPSQIGPKLRPNTEIILVCDTQNFRKGDRGKIVSVNHISGEKKSAVYDFDILMEGIEEKIIRQVPRESIITYYIRDLGIMKDILLARTGYREVVDTLNRLYNPVMMDDVEFD